MQRWPVLIRLDRGSGLANLAVQLLLGATGLAVITFLCFRFGVTLASAAFAYLTLVTLLALIGTFIGAVVLSIAAIACLNYFFVPPIFSFRVEYPEDILAVAAFLTSSLLVAALVTRLRKTAEDAEASRIALVDTLPALTWTAQPDGSRDFHSRRWMEFSGLSTKDAEGQGWGAIIHPDDRPKVLEKWRYAVATGEPFEIEARERNVDGEYRALLIRAQPLRDSKGNIVKWYGACSDIEDLKRATETLRASEDYWKEVFEHNPVMYFIIDPAGTVLSVNEFGAAQLGYTATELVGQSVQKVFIEEDREFVVRNVALCLEDLGHPKGWEARKVRKNGSVIWVREQAKAVRRSDNQLIVLVACEDITEQYETNIELARLGSITASSDDAIIGKGLDGRISAWNAGATRIFGYTSNEMIGQPITRIIPPELHAEESEIFLRLQRGERIDHYETVRVAKDGRRIDMAITVSPILDKSGKVVGASKIGRDITQQKKAEDALRQSESYLSEAQKLSHTGSFGWHVATGKLVWSDETFRIFEIDPTVEPSIELVLQRVHRDDRAALEQLLTEVTQQEKDWTYEHRLLMPGGRIKHLRVAAHADRSGVLNFVGAVMDVSAIKRAEDETMRARTELARVARVAALGELTAAIAHEVNQPLTGLVSSGNACLRWLGGEAPDLEAARRSVQRMIADGTRASEIVARIRAMVSKSVPRNEPLHVNNVVRDVVALVRSEVQEHGLSLRTELNDRLPLVAGDRIQLQQVVLNLLLNASEAVRTVHVGPREVIVRSATDKAGKVLVSVDDTGPGLEPEKFGEVFQAFYTTKPDGMGMGLAVSRSIIEALGGRLWVEPNSPRGARFQFSLPAAHDQAAGP